jgi:hypothetical protein
MDGSAPKMKSNHVDFVRFCSEELKKDSELTQGSLIHYYTEANPCGDTGFANSMFANSYITTAQLCAISLGTLPHPIALPPFFFKKGEIVLAYNKRTVAPECAGGRISRRPF